MATTVTHYEIHPLAYYFPTTDQEHYDDIKASIAANGQRNPIGVWRSAVIDGKTRYKICQELGIEPKVNYLDDDDDPLVYVVEQNALRRHMTTSQRAMTAARISMDSGWGKNTADDTPAYTIEKAAAAFGVSPDSVRDARKVIEHGDVELIERCELPSSAPRSQRMAVSNAAAIVESTIQRQQAEEQGRKQADKEARAAMAELQRQAKEQIDEAEEKARKAAAEAERARYLAERGLTEEFEEQLRKANERAEQNEQRRKTAEEARARAEQLSLDEQQNISDERKKLEEERLRLEEERSRLEAQIAEAQIAAPVAGPVDDAPESEPAVAITHASVPAIEAARNFLDGIELDPLSFDQNTAVQAQHYYTDPDHSLSQQWEAKSLWLELPGQPELCRQFTTKLLHELGKGHVQQGLVLGASAHTGDNWAQQLIASSDAFCFLNAEDGANHSMVFLLGDNAQSDVESFAETFDVLGAVGMSYYESTSPS